MFLISQWQTLQTYLEKKELINCSISQKVGISVAKWRKKHSCIKLEACQLVCDVIAPHDGEVLFQAVQQKKNLGATTDAGLEALVAAYRKAPSKILKTQILSIYANRFTVKELKAIHRPFENLSDRQIKKARAHSSSEGPGMTNYESIGFSVFRAFRWIRRDSLVLIVKLKLKPQKRITYFKWAGHFTSLEVDKRAFLTTSASIYKKSLTLAKKLGERKIPPK